MTAARVTVVADTLTTVVASTDSTALGLLVLVYGPVAVVVATSLTVTESWRGKSTVSNVTFETIAMSHGASFQIVMVCGVRVGMGQTRTSFVAGRTTTARSPAARGTDRLLGSIALAMARSRLLYSPRGRVGRSVGVELRVIACKASQERRRLDDDVIVITAGIAEYATKQGGIG